MNRQEKIVLLGLAVLAVAGGIVKVKFEADADTGDASSVMSVMNDALKRTLVNATSNNVAATTWYPRLSYNSWTVSEYQLMNQGVTPLRDNHPLFRRPKFIGENRHKVMTEGWAGWYYNPPGEVQL